MKKLAGTKPTPRETEVWKLTAAGLTDKQIGRAMHISHRTVRSLMDRLRVRLGVRSKIQLALRWVKRNAQ